MDQRDLSSMPDGSSLEADVCVVGSGPAGASVAAELARGAVRVCLLEGGGTVYERESQAPYAFESVGHPWGRGELERRVRVLGGTSTTWTGRCAPFDALDFAERPWIPHSGWPIARHELDGYLERAGALLGLGPQRYDESMWERFGVAPPRPPLDPALLRTQLWQYSRGENGSPTDFARDVLSRLSDARALTVVVHANVTRIRTRDGGASVTGVEARTLEGKRLTVRSPVVILACGAIENARLLLASNDARPAGLGNEHDLVGRFLMDHLNPPIASFEPARALALLERFGHYWLDDERGRHVYFAGVALSERVQRSRGLPGCTAALLAEPREDAALLALRRVLSSAREPDARLLARDLARVSRAPLELVRAALRRAGHRPEIVPVRSLQLVTMIEQIPDPESRVTLSAERDPLGVPIVRVDWRMHDEEREAALTMIELLERELSRIGMPAPRPARWVLGEVDFRDVVDDISHPVGTTRMAGDPRAGVVDERCAVHGTDGLYVAGGSVFPTAGTANPTLMIVAVALRVADAVRARMEAQAAPSVSTAARPRRAERLRVGILGAGHRVRGVYLPVLEALSDRFSLAGVASRSRERAEALGVPVFEGLDELLTEGRPHLLVSCVSDRENGRVLASLLPLGVPVLTETPLAWSLRDARALARRVAETRALVAVAENWPSFPIEELKSVLREAGVFGRVLAAHDDRASFEYHAIAQLRRYLGPDRRPVEASATRGSCILASRAGHEAWQTGSVRFDDGAMLHHQHGGASAALHRIPGALRIHGELASMADDELRMEDGAVARARRHHDARGALTRLDVDVPGLGVIGWESPYRERPLTDDQVGFALHLDAMRRAVLGEGEPLYRVADALLDVEILRALEASAALSGAPVGVPMSLATTGLRMAATPSAWLDRLRS